MPEQAATQSGQKLRLGRRTRVHIFDERLTSNPFAECGPDCAMQPCAAIDIRFAEVDCIVQ